MRTALQRLSFAAIFAVAACGTQFDLASPHHPYDDGLLKTKANLANSNLPVLETKYYALQTSIDEKRSIRDQIVFTLLELVEEYQRKFNSDLYGGVAAFNTGSEITAGALTAGATISTVASTTRLLSGLATMVIGANASVGKNLLQGRGTDLIIDRMDALRLGKRAEILSALKNDVNSYPLGQALLDVEDYARAGSIPAAIRAIGQDNANAAKAAEEKLLQVHAPSLEKPSSPSPSAH